MINQRKKKSPRKGNHNQWQALPARKSTKK